MDFIRKHRIYDVVAFFFPSEILHWDLDLSQLDQLSCIVSIICIQWMNEYQVFKLLLTCVNVNVKLNRKKGPKILQEQE